MFQDSAVSFNFCIKETIGQTRFSLTSNLNTSEVRNCLFFPIGRTSEGNYIPTSNGTGRASKAWAVGSKASADEAGEGL